MLRSWPGRLARWLVRGYPRRPVAVIATGVLAAALTVAAAQAGPGAGAGPATGAQAAADVQQAAFPLTKIRHVWVIELENTTFSQSFGRPSADRSYGFLGVYSINCSRVNWNTWAGISAAAAKRANRKRDMVFEKHITIGSH